SKFSLRNAGVLHRTHDGKFEAAWIGDLRAKSSVPVKFLPSTDNQPHLAQWDESAETLSYDVQVREVLDRLDSNKDGKISQSEARRDPAILEDFGRIDQSES